MKRTITNKYGLPSSIYNALANDTYVGGGDISITRLIGPPRPVALRKRHEADIVEDASDRIWSLLGQSAHLAMERAGANTPNAKIETRLYMPFKGLKLPNGGHWEWNLSGQPDIWEDGVLSDFKVTSVWSFLFGEKPEWNAQLNLQAMLHRHNGDEVKGIQIIAILRDWQKRKAHYEKDYPPINVSVVPFPLWSFKEQVDYATHRILIHQAAQRDFKLSNYNPDSLPLCTPEERWYRGGAYLVKRKQLKTGKVNKKSDRRANTLEEAESFMANNIPPKGTEYVEVEQVPGVSVRCAEYCDVAAFCPFGQKVLEARAANPKSNQIDPTDDEEES